MFLRVKVDIVGHVALAERHLCLDDGVAALMDVDDGGVVDGGAYVAVVFRYLGKGQQAVDMGQDVGIDLYLRDELLHGDDEFGEETRLEVEYLLVGSQYLFLVFLQFGRDVALGLSQGLLTYPSFRHLVLERVAHLEVIAEDVVVAYFKR